MRLILFVALSSTMLAAQSKPKAVPDVCQLDTLPRQLQHNLARHYGAWRIQEPKDLNPRSRERWEAERPLECPGIASGQFRGTKELSYAVLLVPVEHSSTGYMLAVFNDRTAGPSGMTIVDQQKEAKSACCFIRKVLISSFFDAASLKKFRVEAQEGILLIDAGESEYEADVYFWADRKYQYQPVDY